MSEWKKGDRFVVCIPEGSALYSIREAFQGRRGRIEQSRPLEPSGRILIRFDQGGLSGLAPRYLRKEAPEYE